MMQRYYLLTILLILTTLAVFWPVCSFDFVEWDDMVNVYNNPYFNPVTPGNIFQFWQKPYEGLYIPVSYTVWAVEALISQYIISGDISARPDPLLFHSVNLVFHILNVLLIFAILRLLLNYKSEIQSTYSHDWAAGFGALLFGLHPIQVEPVAWVTGMKDILSGFLSLLAIWQYLVYSSTRNIRNSSSTRQNIKSTIWNPHYFIASLSFLLAMLAKPTAVVVPIIIWLLDCWVLERSAKKSARVLIGWVLMAIPLILLNKMIQPDKNIGFYTPIWARPLVAADAVAFYLYKLVVPVWLGPDYSRIPKYILKYGWAYFTWFVPFILVVFVWFRKDRKWWFVAIGIFVAGILPVLGLIPFQFQNLSTVADRYLYLSMLGPAFGMAWFFSHSRGKLVPIVCVLVLSLFGIRSVFQVQHWRNTITLFTHALKVHPHSLIAQANLGNALIRQGNIPAAIEHLNIALRIDPADSESQNNMGVALAKQNEVNKAIVHFSSALQIRQNNIGARKNLGHALLRQGMTKEAILHFSEVLRTKNDDEMSHVFIGQALAEQGKSNEAIAHYSEALLIKPDNADTHNTIGFALAKQGKLADAVSHYFEALRIKPNFVKAHNNLGLALGQLGKLTKAIEHFSIAMQINPDFADAYNNMGVALIGQGKFDAAIEQFSKALRINPNYAKAHNNMGVALDRQGNLDMAIEHYSEALRIEPGYAKAHDSLELAIQKKRNENTISNSIDQP